MTLPEPIAVGSGGLPVLYSVLGAYIQLEPLVPEDAERLEAANALALDWIGHELRWTGSNVFHNVGAFSAEDLELVSCHPLQLHRGDTAALPGAGALIEAQVAAAMVDEFEVAIHGSTNKGTPWPFSYRFFSMIAEWKPMPLFETHSMLRLTVPDTWPLEDFVERFTAILATLRVRWASAGYTYSTWEYYQYNSSQSAVYAHARRHVGYDTGHYDRQIDAWHDAVRSVNWLTYLGPELASRAFPEEKPLAAPRLVEVTALGEGRLLRAGPAPSRGDINRLDVPAAYVEADALIRAVRATDCLSFGLPWTEDTTRAWLRRFERRVF